jgi:chemotaxis protein MotA
VIGLVLILVGTFVGTILKGANIAFLFTIPAAFLIVCVSAVGAAFMSNDMSVNKNIGKYVGKALKGKADHEATEAIGQIVHLADRARREGLLALEEECNKLEDPFLRKGLQMAIDGTDPEVVRDVMETEVEAMKHRHKEGAELMTQIGIFAPTFGIIGAVIGLIATLGHLSEPEKLGHGISAAFVATFWGVFMANGMFLPWGNRLKALSKEEAAYKQLLIEGVLAIQAGSNPRVVSEMLKGFLPPKQRVSLDEKAA